MQTALEALYQFQIEENVEDFLISGPSLNNKKEILYIYQHPKTIELGLFIEPSLLKTLEHHNPLKGLSAKNLSPFCTALEGVSHFLYLLGRVALRQPVTRLELELQAEIDKYLLTSALYHRHFHRYPPFLFQYLFENFQWCQSVTLSSRQRYQQANRFAAKFCTDLEQNYLRQGKWDLGLNQARQFYFQNHWNKMRQLTP